MWSPWPEELNRRIAGLVSQLHFPPTQAAAENLLREHVPADKIEITGNTVIDALLQVRDRLKSDEALLKPLQDRFAFLRPERKLVLVTGHRRENFGDGVQQICHALLALADRGDLQVVYAVHLNPNVKGPVETALRDRSNVHLIPPQDYLSFVYLMMNSYLILTDSGGIQEEAPSLGKPVLVMRDTTERPEAVEAGTARLVGASTSNIVTSACELLDDPRAYAAMSNRSNPYGDGAAAARIVRRVERFLSEQP
jgi:UDP-N-acetylglucosamine 2-epimerase